MNALRQTITDPQGKPSAMRTASLLAVGTGCAMLLAASFNWGNPELTKDALWCIALGLAGKGVQRFAEPNFGPRESEGTN